MALCFPWLYHTKMCFSELFGEVPSAVYSIGRIHQIQCAQEKAKVNQCMAMNTDFKDRLCSALLNHWEPFGKGPEDESQSKTKTRSRLYGKMEMHLISKVSVIERDQPHVAELLLIVVEGMIFMTYTISFFMKHLLLSLFMANSVKHCAHLKECWNVMKMTQ